MLQMLRVTVDDMFKFDKQIANICRKESQQVAVLRCFDTVFKRPYRYFSIALKVVFSLSRNWLWIESCENAVLSKIKWCALFRKN